MKSFSLVSLLLSLLAPITLAAQGDKSNLPWADISGQKQRQIVVAAGTPDLYNGHPTTVLLDDEKTMICTWSNGHGGKAAFIDCRIHKGLSRKLPPIVFDHREAIDALIEDLNP